MIRYALTLLLLLLSPPRADAQTLAARLQQLSPGQWLSYDVTLQPGLHAPCCFNFKRNRERDGSCRLEQRDWSYGHRDSDPLPPPGSALRVLLRRDDDGYDRVRAVGAHCPIDTGTAHVVEAGAADPEQSVLLLQQALAADGRERGHAASAIAHHADRAADAALIDAAAVGRDEELRRDAVFWLAQARGESGFRHVRNLLEHERNDDLLRHEVFAIGISKARGADVELRALARDHAREAVRAEAIFWLAQGDDVQAEAVIQHALARDPSHEVRSKAIFALSQLPAARAVPALRALVEHGATREVRKEALFWLAQVDDDAVLPVFDALLDPEAR